MRRGLPEPKTFVNALKEEEEEEGRDAAEAGRGPPQQGAGFGSKYVAGARPAGSDGSAGPPSPDASLVIAARLPSKASLAASEEEESEVDATERGALSNLHGHTHAKTPVVRLLKNNWIGLTFNFLYGAWCVVFGGAAGGGAALGVHHGGGSVARRGGAPRRGPAVRPALLSPAASSRRRARPLSPHLPAGCTAPSLWPVRFGLGGPLEQRWLRSGSPTPAPGSGLSTPAAPPR
jgi:hypothetical protein